MEAKLEAKMDGLKEEIMEAGMILGAKFLSWDNFPWFFQKRDLLF